jgi:Tfp pilus assembly PilM family ATPase/Tfp pilus assembly protein PilN
VGRRSAGVDIGSSTVKLVAGEAKGNGFVLTSFAIAKNARGTIAGGWEALAGTSLPAAARVGLTGRDVNVRYVRVPHVPDWQLRRLMRFEAAEVGGQSDAAVASDFNLLPEIPEIEGEDVVLLCLARESLLAEHAAGLTRARGRLDAFTPNAVALYNAFLRYGQVMDDTVLVANIGRENIDVILVRGADLLFARNLLGGSRLFDEALIQRFGISAEKAERIKLEETTIAPGATFRDANQERASRALYAPAGQILSLIQSTVLFCKGQLKLSTLRLDRVLLCGGGAGLEGLTRYLNGALGVPVELFDPFVVVDATRLDGESQAELDEHRLEAVVALGLATSASDAEAYSIEILPDATRKRREFTRGTLFLIASGVILLAYLGLFAWQKRVELGERQREAARLEAELRRRRSSDQETRALLEESAALEEHARELWLVGGAGEQLVRTLDTLERSLPADFWLESLSAASGADDGLGVMLADPRPIVRVKGRTREGADAPAALFEEFAAAVRRALPEAEVRERLSNVGADFSLDLSAFTPRAIRAPDTAPDGTPAGGDAGDARGGS